MLKTKHTMVIFLVTVLLAACARSTEITIVPETQVQISQGETETVVITDSDGIKGVVGMQRIPSGAEYRDLPIDFQFNEPGIQRYNINVGNTFDAPGTVLHVEVTDMKGNETFHFIRSTPQGYQTGTFTKSG